jgi:hypothetical protein
MHWQLIVQVDSTNTMFQACTREAEQINGEFICQVDGGLIPRSNSTSKKRLRVPCAFPSSVAARLLVGC